MGYGAKGRVELTSTKEIDELVAEHISDFLLKNKHVAKEIKHLEEDFEGVSTLKRLFDFAGFDLSDSSFEYVINKEPETLLHTLRLSGNWNDIKVLPVLEYLASLGMGIFGEFQGEDGLTWEYNAEFNSKVLKESSTLALSKINESAVKAETLDKVASIIGVTSEELTRMVESGEFAHRVILSNP